MKTLWTETLIVVLAGVVLGFAANAFSPRGINLSRNYFPPPAASTNAPIVAASTNGVDPGPDPVAARLATEGLQLASYEIVAETFGDPKYQQGLFIIIDARKLEDYESGHIPNAYRLDYYRPENDLPVVLPAAQIAERIIVYCKGGQCEDSEFTARLLVSAGIPAPQVFVYTQGFDDWKERGMPVETGARGSGSISGGGNPK